MTTVFIDRTAVQNKMAALISTKLVGAGKPVQAVYSYQVADINKQSPVVIITSGGSQRRNPEKSARNTSLIFLDVHVLVLYANATDSWTEQHSEAALNVIEKGIDEVVADNNETDVWMNLDFAGKSMIEPVVISGLEYRYEVIPLSAEVTA